MMHMDGKCHGKRKSCVSKNFALFSVQKLKFPEALKFPYVSIFVQQFSVVYSFFFLINNMSVPVLPQSCLLICKIARSDLPKCLVLHKISGVFYVPKQVSYIFIYRFRVYITQLFILFESSFKIQWSLGICLIGISSCSYVAVYARYKI